MKSRILCAILSLLLLVIVSAGAVAQYDFEGRTIGVSFRFHDITPFGERGALSWNDPDPRLQAHIENVAEMFNADIQIVPHPGEWNTMRDFAPAILAGDSEVSVFEIDFHSAGNNLYPLAMEGYLTPLDDYLDHEYYQSLPESFRSTSGFVVAGRTYGFEPLNALIEPCVIIWNRDMFEREGFPMLDELYLAGEWTWDVFADLAIRATRDTTGDGEIDQYGMGMFWGRNDHISNFIYTNGGSLTRMEDGRVMANFDSPEAIEALDFLQDLIFNHNTLLAGGTAQDGRIAMSMGLPHILQRPEYRELDDRYSIVPLPKGPRMDEHVYPLWNRWMAVVPVTEADPRAVIEVVNALRILTDDYLDVPLDEWEYTFWDHWSLFLHDRLSLEVWQDAARNRIYTDNRPVFLNNGGHTAINQIVNDGVGAAQAVAQVVTQVQSALDDLYNTQ